MKKKQILGPSLFLIVILFLSISFADSPAKGADPSAENIMFKRELLFFKEIPVVITAAKKEQPITEAPSAITVITALEIKESGAVNLADILRMVPGIEVMSVTASNINVNARGLNQLMSNKMLVMVDGRTIYLDFYGIVRWDSIPVPLEEIKRIEVIRGPGSALYGANAFSGVINVITMSPAELAGTLVSLTGGGNDTWRGTVIHAGILDRFDYKFSLSGDRRNQWKDQDERSGEFGRVNGSIEYKIDRSSKLVVSAGLSHLDNDIFPNDLTGPIDTEGPATYLSLLYQGSHSMFRYFWNRSDYEIHGQPYLPESDMITDIHDFEFQHSFSPAKRHSLIFGGDYRIKMIDWDEMLYDEKRENILSFFIQDEYKPLANILLVMGGRYDNHPLTGGRFSPRGSALYSPDKNHTFRLSVSSAYRTPTFLDSYGSFNLYPVSLNLPLGIKFSPPVKVDHNRNLDPEKILSFELGYQTDVFERIKARCDLFYNEIEGLIFPDMEGPLFSLTSPHIYWEAGYLNYQDVRAFGGEISLDILIAPRLTGKINYSYQQLTDKDTHRRIRSAPEHKINVGIGCKLPRDFSAHLSAHYVDETRWDLLGIIPKTRKVDPYLLVNARLGRLFMNDRLEVALAVFNLFHDKHREHPLGAELGSRLSFSFSYRF